MPEAAKTKPPMRVMVFSHPRTVSSLFTYLFKGSQSGQKLEIDNFYFFFDAFYLGKESPTPYRHLSQHPKLPDATADPHEIFRDETYQAAYECMRDIVQKAEKEGRTFFHKEHIFFTLKPEVAARHLPKDQAEKLLASIQKREEPVIVEKEQNEELLFPRREGETECPIFVPESFLRTLSPCFTIRHPGLVFPSFYRLSSKTFGAKPDDAWAPVDFSLKWSRLLFDWYRSIGAKDPWPIVIDAEDLVKRTAVVIKLFKEKTGLDIEERHEWEQKIPGEVAPLTFPGTLLNSTKVIDDPRYDKPIVLEEEKVKWAEEWDEETANTLYKAAKRAMPDYEYLRGFRLH